MDRLGRDGLFRAEVAVDGAVRQTHVFGNRVNAGGADSLFPEEASSRSQNVLTIFRSLFLRNPHLLLLIFSSTLDSFDDERYECIKHDDRNQYDPSAWTHELDVRPFKKKF